MQPFSLVDGTEFSRRLGSSGLSLGVRLTQTHIMVHSCLDLLVHRLLHLPLCVSAVAVEHNDKNENGNNRDDQQLSITVAMVTDIEHARLVVVLEIWVLQDRFAHVRCVVEASADGIHDSLCLHLTPVGAIVDNNRRNNIASVLVPKVNLIFNYFVLGLDVHPLGLVTRAEAVSYASLGAVPVEASQILMCKLGALFSDLTAAIVMDLGHVPEKQVPLILLISLLVNTLLPQVFKDDLLTAQFVTMVSGAVPAAGIAVGLNEIVSAVHALPVNEMGSHEDAITELLVDVLEVLQEIENQIIVGGVPHVILDSVVGPGHLELDHHGNLVLGLLITLFHEIN